MADLISRAEAIGAFMGKPPEYYHTSYIVGELNCVPAVDAVPVEWLHKKREQMIDAAQNTPEQAIAYVLCLWQKEQEARYCKMGERRDGA